MRHRLFVRPLQFLATALSTVALILAGSGPPSPPILGGALAGVQAAGIAAVAGGAGGRGLSPSGAGSPQNWGAGGGRTPPLAANVELVGDLWLPGVHGNVWAHRGFAYVGTWNRPCTNGAIKVIDATDPTSPQLVSRLAEYAGTSTEDVAVLNVDTPAFRGDLLAVGLQPCGRGVSGVDFWDVSDPANPQLLGFFETPGTGGVHELHLFRREGRVFALLAVPYSELGTRDGDVRILDVTDPSNPVQLADWGAFRDLGVSRAESRGSFRAIYAHSVSVSPDGGTAYLSYWDAGMIQLDISDPAAPRFVSRITYAGWEQGDTHSALVSRDGQTLLVADELLSPPWGFLRVYDVADPANPQHLADFATPHTRGEVDDAGPVRGGWYSVHYPVWQGNLAYVGWFTDGLRVLDLSDPSDPREIGYYVPEGSPKIWGVAVENDLVYLSDMNHGLHIVRLVRPRAIELPLS